jgi:hypothetical protein
MIKIYLSSTFEDLRRHRRCVYDALRMLGHDVKAMEDYVAKDERPLVMCLNDVADCDAYVGIFAWRYGYIPEEDNPEKKSITELEYRQARMMNKICLIFLLEEKQTPWPPEWMDSFTGHADRGDRIKALRHELAKRHSVKFFRTRERLATLVNASVQRHYPSVEDTANSDLARACRFDLQALVGECKDSVPDHGLVGLGVPCGDHILLEKICERLKEELGRKETDVVLPPRPLDPLLSENLAARICSYERRLKSRDVICAVNLYTYEPGHVVREEENINLKFWKAIRAKFKDLACTRLIIVMGSSACGPFPEGVVELPQPSVTKDLVSKWVRKVGRGLKWAEDKLAEWEEFMIAECWPEDKLHISAPYEHIEYAMALLHQEDYRAPEAFLKKLRGEV